MICNKCGKTLPDDSTFCQFCGSKIEIPTTPAEETPSISKEEALAKILAAGVVEGHKAVEANRAAQPQNEADSQFGLVPEKPIYTAGIDEQERYLQSLRTPTGEPIKWSRRGSMSVHGVHGMIDVYDIYLMSGAEYKTIYINMYGARNSTMAPSGFVLMTPAPKATAVKAPKQKEPKVSKPKKPVNKKLVVCLTVIPIAVIILALLAVFVLVPGLKYNHAKSLLENGNYELAYSEFLALDGYSNSENMLLECRYVQAIKYRDAGDYELANKIFESLGNYRDSKILIHEHDYKVSDTVAATCVVARSETFKCAGCGDSYTKTYNKAEHKYDLVSSVAATCIVASSETFKCSDCGDSYTKTYEKAEHKYNLVSTVAATCSAAGSESYKCSVCDDSYIKTLDKLDHSYSVSSSTDATCNATGSKTYTCAGCNDTYNETIDKLTHNYTVVSTQAPTCQKEGYTTHKCSLCSDEYTETKGKVSHDTVLSSTTDSTCTTVGSKNYKCKNCSYTYSEEIAKKSHNYSAATCTSPKTCSMCRKTEGTALGHSDTLICTKCNQSTFEALTFTGTGEGFIRNLNLPKGKYLFIIETPTGDFIQLHINERYIGYNNMSQETYSVLSVTVSSAVTNGYLKVSADEGWKITIEAVGN